MLGLCFYVLLLAKQTINMDEQKPILGSESPEANHRFRGAWFQQRWDRIPRMIQLGLAAIGVALVIFLLWSVGHHFEYIGTNHKTPAGLEIGPDGQPLSGNRQSSSSSSTEKSSSGGSGSNSNSSSAPGIPTSTTNGSKNYDVVFDSNRTGHFEIYRLNTNGATVQLTNNASYDSWWPKPSPNGKQVLFYRTPAGVHDRDYGQTSMWMMNIDGTNLRQIIANKANGWAIHGHGEWSPDGTKLTMFGNAYVYTTDINGNILSKLAVGIDPTFSSDGKQIIYISCATVGCPQSAYRVYRMNIDGSGVTQLENLNFRANDPFMSPDGKTIIWEGNPSGLVWNIYAMNADGSNVRTLVSDGNINTNPVWAPNNTIFFFKTSPANYKGFGLWSVNRDGSSLSWISKGQTGSNEYVSVIP